jgi:hypothetical protein
MAITLNNYIKEGPIRENGRIYYMCECPQCGNLRKVRKEALGKIKSCHPCHHSIQRPPKPEGDVHWCNKCTSWKTKDNFNFRRDGKSRNCKKCEDEYRRANLSKINEYAKKYRKKNIEQAMLSAAKARAKESGVQFNIDISDIIVPKTCPVLGIKLSTSGSKQNSPSLDRIFPQYGYTKGNVRVISWRANWIKNNATPEEIEKLFLDSISIRTLQVSKQ